MSVGSMLGLAVTGALTVEIMQKAKPLKAAKQTIKSLKKETQIKY